MLLQSLINDPKIGASSQSAALQEKDHHSFCLMKLAGMAPVPQR
jgi:hypothetical protein